VRRRLPKDRLGRLFAAFVAVNAVIIAILGWQAVESQEVKGSLQGGEPVRFEPPLEGLFAPARIVAEYVNAGDRILTLEGAELLDAPEGLELVDVGARKRGAGTLRDLEGFEIAPAVRVEVVALVDVAAPQIEAAIPGIRVHYRSGGRSGLTP
jgi:hypothetical protein